MKIGIFLGTMGSASTLNRLVQQIVDVESDGFDSFWTAQVSGSDALTLLAVGGQQTRRIELGTAVVPTFTRHPIVMAQQALTTQSASSGRLLLGMGLSHQPVVENRWGLKFDRPALHMKEYLLILQSLVDTGKVDYDGSIFNVHSEIQRVSTDPIPICIAALAPKMLHLAGTMAQGTITWMVGPRTLTTHIIPKINAAAEIAGRPSPRVCVGLPICVTNDRDAALERAAGYFQNYGNLPSYRRMMDIEGVENPAAMAIIGTESEVEKQLRTLSNSGSTDFLASIFPDNDDSDASVARTRALLKNLVGKL